MPPSQRRPPKVYLTAGKGGAGKSLVAVLFASTCYLKDRAIKLFDADPANPTLARFYPELYATEQILSNLDRDTVEYWLENGPFSETRTEDGLCDLGANVDRFLLEWLADRGSVCAVSCRFLVPITNIESVTAASTIFENLGGARMLLIANDFGGLQTRAAIEDKRITDMRDKGIDVAYLPNFRRTAAEMSLTRIAPHVTAQNLTNRFAAQGAVTMLRYFEAMFERFPDFRPW